MQSGEIQKVAVYVFAAGAAVVSARGASGQDVEVTLKTSSRGVPKYVFHASLPASVTVRDDGSDAFSSNNLLRQQSDQRTLSSNSNNSSRVNSNTSDQPQQQQLQVSGASPVRQAKPDTSNTSDALPVTQAPFVPSSVTHQAAVESQTTNPVASFQQQQQQQSSPVKKTASIDNSPLNPVRPPVETVFAVSDSGKHFLYQGTLKRAAAGARKDAPRVVVSTDLGGTLCGERNSLRDFNLLWLEHFYFDKRNSLIYNTGRSYDSFFAIRNRENLLMPDWLITRCGCGVYENKGGKLEEHMEWRAVVREGWHYEPIQAALQHLQWLQFKQRNDQEVLSLKYFLRAVWDDTTRRDFEAVERALKEDQNLPFVWYLREKSNGVALEIIPVKANKGQSLKFILEKINARLEDVLTFGDSMNDIGMMTLGNESVLVSNSHADVKHWAEQQKGHYQRLRVSGKSNASALVESVEARLQAAPQKQPNAN